MTRHNLHRLALSTFQTITATGLALTLLTACASPAAQTPRAERALSVTDKWASKVQVDAHPDEILLAPHADGLSPNQAQALDSLLNRWLKAEAREIVVSAPTGGPNAETSARAASAARQRLLAMGAPAAKVRIVGYDAGAAPDAPLKVGFLRYVAAPFACGEWENLTATRKNDAYGNFGCAVTSNMVAQVANPEDLVNPRDTTPADAGRRDTVLGKYREGAVTSSAKDEQATGSISKAVN